MESIRSKIKRRLQKFIELDVSGLRSYILSIFLNNKKVTVDDLHQAITKNMILQEVRWRLWWVISTQNWEF